MRSSDEVSLREARSEAFSAALRRASHAYPERTAFRFEGRSLSFGKLDDLATRCSSAFRERGVGAGDRVVLLCANHLEFIIACWGAWRLGAVVVPLNFRLTANEVQQLLTDCRPAVLVVDEAFTQTVPTVGVPVLVVDAGDQPHAAGWTDFTQALEAADPVYQFVAVDENETCLIMYTSGTTGMPKGAMLSYRNLLAQSLLMTSLFRLAPHDEVHSCAVPLFHIAGIGSVIPFFLLGGRSVIQRLGGFDPARLLDLLEREEITDVFLVPTQWEAVCRLADPRTAHLPLRRIAWGAAPISRRVLELMAESFPQAEIIAGFGQTEMSPITCALRGSQSAEKIGSVGQVVPLVEARIVDSAMNDVPRGAVGEIVYRGPTMMLGYWERPEETAQAFAGGWFHSGDLVRMDDDGFVYVVDRVKDMLISGGENIYCAEVESAILAHPAVREVAVIGRPHERWGEVPVAIVVREPGTQSTAKDLDEHVRHRLAAFKCPRAYEWIDALPRNASGKVTKHRLRENYAQ